MDAASLPISREETLRYLRHRGGPLTEEMEALLKSCEEELRAAARPRYCHRFFGLERRGKALALTGSGALPVSYTHLDVYKRQSLERKICRFWR